MTFPLPAGIKIRIKDDARCILSPRHIIWVDQMDKWRGKIVITVDPIRSSIGGATRIPDESGTKVITPDEQTGWSVCDSWYEIVEEEKDPLNITRAKHSRMRLVDG